MWSRLHAPASVVAVASTAAVFASLKACDAEQPTSTTQGTWKRASLSAAAALPQWPVCIGSSNALRCEAAAKEPNENAEDTSEAVENWSSTHKVTTKAFLRPENTEEVERIVQQAHRKGTKLRVLGNAISPNGIGLSEDTMLSMVLCDKVLEVDPSAMTVRVQAGATVQKVTEALKPYSLTLQNFASINEQQIGGFIQVGAHGTGPTIPPVDEQVVSMRLVTPGLGALEIGQDSNPDLFNMVKVGLGAFGVVTEVTLQCVPRHRLVETTKVMKVKEVVDQHERLLRENRHTRYMWIPHTDSVVVVTCNPLGVARTLTRTLAHLPAKEVVPSCSPAVQGSSSSSGGGGGGDDEDDREEKRAYSEEERLRPLVELLADKVGGAQAAKTMADIFSFADLRDKLLALDPLNKAWVVKVNRAEAQFWERSEGQRVDFSDKVLAFECGGQQWVDEVAFPTGSLHEPSGADIAYMLELLRMIEEHDVPAPAPIEQRWTAHSSSFMSPAHVQYGNDKTMYSWVGIIHYLPTDDPEMREAITKSFFEYRDLCEEKLWAKYDAAEHWAKLEKPPTHCLTKTLQQRIRKRFPVDQFNELRKLLDPKNIMANPHLDAIFGTGQYDYSQPKPNKKS